MVTTCKEEVKDGGRMGAANEVEGETWSHGCHTLSSSQATPVKSWYCNDFKTTTRLEIVLFVLLVVFLRQSAF